MSRFCFIFTLCVVVVSLFGHTTSQTTDEPFDEFVEIDQRFEQYERQMESLLTHISWLNVQQHEARRYDGDSGILQTRVVEGGTREYFENTWSMQNGPAAIHSHSEFSRILGMGESTVVMNGVVFRTRHNDYLMYRPSTTSSKFREVEEIPFPPVPPSVLGKSSVAEQITEMREYFRAFKNQDTTIRNYKPYFKPVLCYMEGMWVDFSQNLSEPFKSDRHQLNSYDWYSLRDEVLYNTLSGKKDVAENAASLPTWIMGKNADGSLKVAQWNYRILCKDLSSDVPLNRFRVVDDLAQMMRKGKSVNRYAKSRSARFQLNPYLSDDFDGTTFTEGPVPHMNYLDELMYQVTVYQEMINLEDSHGLMDLYLTALDTPGLDASGFESSPWGFSDSNLWTACTKQAEIIEIQANCEDEEDCPENIRSTYAIPMEIVYLTPLQSWNPYDIPLYRGEEPLVNRMDESAPRNGGNSALEAFNGSSQIVYYRTPAEFFDSTPDEEQDPADTVERGVHVLDGNDVIHQCEASGIYIITPNIPGVGSVRTRWPIMPVHAEGSATFKELTALKDLVRRGADYQYLYENPIGSCQRNSTTGGERFRYVTRPGFGGHFHEVELTKDQILALKNGVVEWLDVTTSLVGNHRHDLTLVYDSDLSSRILFMYACDGVEDYAGCADDHPSDVYCTDCPDAGVQ